MKNEFYTFLANSEDDLNARIQTYKTRRGLVEIERSAPSVGMTKDERGKIITTIAITVKFGNN